MAAHSPTGTRRAPSLWLVAWRLRAILTPALAALAGAWWLTGRTGAPWWASLPLTLAFAACVIAARGGFRRRLNHARDGLEGIREARGRFRARYLLEPGDVPRPDTPEGRFYLGRRWPGGTQEWLPWDGDGPHLLVCGSTGYGKSECVNLIVHQAVSWGWEVRIIDGKPGTEYWWLTHRLGDDVVVQEPDAMRDALVAAVADMRARYDVLRNTPIVVTDLHGREREGRPLTLRHAPQHVRDTMPPRLLVVEEAATVVGGRDKTSKAAADALRELVQLGRSVGIHVVISMQRPDSDLLPGFAKAQAGGRILFGPADRITTDMVVGEAVRASLEASDAPADRPRGRAVACDVGGAGWSVFQCALLDRDALLPAAGSEDAGDEPEVAGSAGAAADPDRSRSAGPPSQGGGDDATPAAGDGSADAPALALTPPAGGPQPPEGGLVAAAGAIGPVSALRSPIPSRARLSCLARAAGRRLLVAIPARWRLRLAAIRLVAAPRVRGPVSRDRALRGLVAARDGGTCGACRRPAGADWEADHRTPLWAGGRDDIENMWVLCRRCHAAKTRAEARVRRWRDRVIGWAAVGERLPGYVWSTVAACVVGLWHGVFGGPGDGVCVLVAAGACVVVWLTRPKGRGLDGLATLDARLEAQHPGLLGDAAGLHIRAAVAWHSFRLAVALVAGGYLVARVAVWWVSRNV